jgi:putative transposase
LTYVREVFGFSDRRASWLIGLSRATLYYKPKERDDAALTARILELAREKKRWGAPMIHKVVNREGLVENHKRTERIYYKVLMLSLRRKRRKKFKSAPREQLPAPTMANQCWAMDFVHDMLSSGRRLKNLNIVDEYTRECLAIETDSSIGGKRVVRVLEMLKDLRGLPESIRSDNGPEFTSKAMDEWAYKNGVKLNFIAPGKPTQNAVVESFNGKFRNECLNENWFDSVSEAKTIIEDWRNEYNGFRPHSSLGSLTPLAFAARAVQNVEFYNSVLV